LKECWSDFKTSSLDLQPNVSRFLKIQTPISFALTHVDQQVAPPTGFSKPKLKWKLRFFFVVYANSSFPTTFLREWSPLHFYSHSLPFPPLHAGSLPSPTVHEDTVRRAEDPNQTGLEKCE
jgi:hypothetical protein